MLVISLTACGHRQDSGHDSEHAPSSAGSDNSPKSDKESPQASESEQSQKSSKSPSDEQDPGDEDGSDVPGSSPKFDLGEIPEVSEKGNPDIGCDIDFLFVVDNSGSMRDEQANLARSVPKFIKTMTQEIENLESYHIGVTSTDEGFFNGPAAGGPCKQLGGLVIRTLAVDLDDAGSGPGTGGSKDCGPYANGKNFMTSKDKLGEAFTCAARIGTLGNGDERPMDAMIAATGPQLAESGACNEGFLRKDAILVVVVITDEEDDKTPNEDGAPQGSNGDPSSWHKTLLQLKDNRPEYLVVLSLIGLPEPNECSETHQTGKVPNLTFEGAEISPRLKAFTELFGDRGFVGDVCAPDYDPFFQEAVKMLDLACEEAPG